MQILIYGTVEVLSSRNKMQTALLSFISIAHCTGVVAFVQTEMESNRKSNRLAACKESNSYASLFGRGLDHFVSGFLGVMNEKGDWFSEFVEIVTCCWHPIANGKQGNIYWLIEPITSK